MRGGSEADRRAPARPEPESAAAEPLSLRQLGVLVALVEQGSFGKAARHLGLSQSTVSGHVADLERRLGARLVERARKGVEPTAAGRALLPHAREALRAEANARSAVSDLTGLVQGTLAVGGSTIPAAHLIPPLIAGFHRVHPKISLSLVTGDSQEILDRVRSGDVEVGFVGLNTVRPGIQAIEVGEDRLVLVVPPGHPFAKRRTVPVAEIPSTPLVLREPGSGTRVAMLSALAEALGDGRSQPLQVVLEVGSTETLKAAVRHGLGVAFVSNLAVQHELAAKALVSVPVDGFDSRRTFHLVTRDEAHLSPAARAFRNHVLAERTTAASGPEARR